MTTRLEVNSGAGANTNSKSIGSEVIEHVTVGLSKIGQENSSSGLFELSLRF